MNRTSGVRLSLMNTGDDDHHLHLPVKAVNFSPIIPRASIAGRALVAIVAIMTFLASLMTGVVLLVRASAAEWQSEVASEITIQLRPVTGRDMEHDSRVVADSIRAQPGIVDVRPFTSEESARLLEPWLGIGLSLSDLPVPRVIVARMASNSVLDLAGLSNKLAQLVPSVTVDDHRAWIKRIRVTTNATVFIGIGILTLVIIATIISVSFATHGAMEANRPIVEVLHFVGASDRYVAHCFLRHFLLLGFEGGLIGVVVAMLLFRVSESIGGWFVGTPAGDQFAALLGTFSLHLSDYLLLLVQAGLIAAITCWTARRTLFATLENID